MKNALRTRYATLSVIFLIALAVRLLLINYHSHNPNFSIQQDSYADYAHALVRGEITQYEEAGKRLFPGYPLLISIVSIAVKSEIVSGVLISLLASLGSVYLFWLLTKNRAATFVFSLFPPIWVVQSTKVATEPITVFLLLMTLFFYLRKNYFLSGVLLGCTFDIRLITVCLFFALLYHAFRIKSFTAIKSMVFGFLPFALLLPFYNYLVLDRSVYYQFVANPSIGRVTIGAVQIIQDFFRAIDWGQYRILVSGTLYVIANVVACILLYRKRNRSALYTIASYWMTFSLVFIFSLGPTPLLEEFSRFTVPLVPALLLGLLPLPIVRLDKKKDTIR